MYLFIINWITPRKLFCQVHNSSLIHLQHVHSLLKKHEPLGLSPKKPLKYDAPSVQITNIIMSSPPSYKKGELIATRVVYGTVLVKISQANPRVLAFDADVRNSTFADKLKKHDATKFIDCFVAEQNMVSVATGAATRDRAVVFVSTFGAFFSRAFDQVMLRQQQQIFKGGC